MWQTSPSIVHQEVSYSTFKQFGIDFAIGKNKKAESKEAATGEAARAQTANNPGKMKS